MSGKHWAVQEMQGSTIPRHNRLLVIAFALAVYQAGTTEWGLEVVIADSLVGESG